MAEVFSVTLPHTDTEPFPTLNFKRLDTLWLQVSGTLCNLACLHCFITCGPKNDSHGHMTLEQVAEHLEWAKRHGVKEYYFTGGEPFMNPQIREMIERTLKQGPLSILTNGILITDGLAKWLGEMERASPYSFDLRVSLDGADAEENDAIRGRNTFERILAGAQRLLAHGINPVLTVTTCHAELAMEEGRERFMEMMRGRGFTQPRVKFMAPLKIGREARRRGGEGGYRPSERLYTDDVPDPDTDHLQCDSCRMVTEKGVFPCPILIEEPGARMGDTLDDAIKPIKLNHSACYTCHVMEFSCKT
ncbi:MAG: radical SAM protein [Myxococcota bacterium]